MREFNILSAVLFLSASFALKSAQAVSVGDGQTTKVNKDSSTSEQKIEINAQAHIKAESSELSESKITLNGEEGAKVEQASKIVAKEFGEVLSITKKMPPARPLEMQESTPSELAGTNWVYESEFGKLTFRVSEKDISVSLSCISPKEQSDAKIFATGEFLKLDSILNGNKVYFKNVGGFELQVKSKANESHCQILLKANYLNFSDANEGVLWVGEGIELSPIKKI